MHSISNKLRKSAHEADRGDKGRLFIVEVAEMNKDFATGNKVFTNYKAFINAKTPAHIDYCRKNYVEGAVLEVSCESLIPDVGEYNGKPTIAMIMQRPSVKVIAYPPENQQQGQQQGSQQSYGQNRPAQQAAPAYRQPQQAAPQKQSWGNAPAQQAAPQLAPKQQFNEPAMDFDNDIPF